MSYTWSRMWCVMTDVDDPVKRGDEIQVLSSKSGAKTVIVVSATVVTNQHDVSYKVLLTRDKRDHDE